MPEVSRRTVTSLAAVAGIGAPLLAACSDESVPPAADPTGSGTPSSEPTSASPTPSPSPTEPSESESPPAGGDAIASTSDIEVGGGTIVADERVVITQPTKGEFKCFSSTCTHMGCQVGEVSDGVIRCPCHGSVFAIEDGAVVGGPAESPLPEVAISVKGGQITLA